MKGKLTIPAACAALLIATVAFAGHHAGSHGVVAAPLSHVAPHSMDGRIVAVRRVSQIITLQTADGESHDVKIPSTATITTHSGSHFNSVRSGQHVHLTAVNDAAHGLVARSLAIP
jgi:hypothetical protein